MKLSHFTNMTNKTQLQWVRDRLLYDGEVSRNAALEMFITRLGARINDLKNNGWVIDGKWVKYEKGKDYRYYLVSSPLNKVVYKIPQLGKEMVFFE